MKDCLSFELWLDEGRPAARAAGALAHAANCPRCTSALAAERQLEAELSRPPEASAPAGFRSAVLARVRVTEAQARAPRRAPAARIREFALDPVTATSAALAALLWWQRALLWTLSTRFAADAAAQLAAGFSALAGTLAAAVAQPAPLVALHVFTRADVQLGLLLAELPLLWWSARTLRMPERIARRTVRA